MTDLVVSAQRKPLVGSVPLPSDPHIGLCAILLAALAADPSEVRGHTRRDASAPLVRALASMGVAVENDGRGTMRVRGVGLDGLHPPAGAIECGTSVVTLGLLSGVLAAQRFASTLTLDASRGELPLASLADPLRRRGASIEGVFSKVIAGEIHAPLSIGPLAESRELDETEQEVRSSDAKSALLFSGLYADGTTTLVEPFVSRDHTERMMRALGVPIASVGPLVRLDPSGWPRLLPGFAIDLPGDPSAAAYLLSAGLLVPNSRVGVRGISLNPTRTAFLDVTRQMGALVQMEVHGDPLGEPIGNLTTGGSDLHRALVAGELSARAIGEIPALAVLAARARGTSEITDLHPAGRTNRAAPWIRALRAFGVEVEERAGGAIIEGRPERPLRAAEVDCASDPAIAMASVVLALVADGPSRIRGADCIAEVFPKFVASLRALGAEIEVVVAR